MPGADAGGLLCIGQGQLFGFAGRAQALTQRLWIAHADCSEPLTGYAPPTIAKSG